MIKLQTVGNEDRIHKAYKIAEKIKSPFFRALVLINISKKYRGKDEKKALTLLSNALKIVKTEEQKNLFLFAISKIAFYYAEFNQYSYAIKLSSTLLDRSHRACLLAEIALIHKENKMKF